MNTQGERQNFNWRPNDNSSTTLTRYSLEAEHWTKAFRSASFKGNGSMRNFFGVIGLILQLAFNLVWLLIYGIGSLFVWLFGNKRGGKFDMPLPPSTKVPSDDEITRAYKDAKEIDIYG